jgi:DUF971 family protein
MLQPEKLQMLSPETLQIRWPGGELRNYGVRHLRDHCPCATCMEQAKAPAALLPVITAAEVAPLQITKMEPMGRYAYAIHFSDGHDTGLYTLESLQTLGEVVSR